MPPTQRHQSAYTYDALGRLSSYTGYDGYTQSYRYNAFDLLAEKTSSGNANRLTQEEYVSGRTLTDPAAQLQDATTRYTWDITRSFGVLLSESTGSVTTNYEYGFERISAISGNTKTEYLYDPRGSVAAELLYPVAGTGSADSTPNRIEVSFKSYSPFGELLTGKHSGFGYNGESYDAATGALYLRARYYEPALNRFSQKDIDRGTVTNPKSLNRYLYTWNNPVSYVDLDGQRVTQWADLGGGSSPKKATATTPLLSTSKPTTPKPPVRNSASKYTPVDFQEQPVSVSSGTVQQNLTRNHTNKVDFSNHSLQKTELHKKTCSSPCELRKKPLSVGKYTKKVIDNLQTILSDIHLTHSEGFVLSGSLTGVWEGSVQTNTSIDMQGNYARQYAYAGGLTTGSPGISIGKFDTITNAPSIDYLNGPGTQVGIAISTPVPFLIIGIDMNIIPQPDNEGGAYVGLTRTIAIGTPTAELHVEWGEGFTEANTRVNLFDLLGEMILKHS